MSTLYNLFYCDIKKSSFLYIVPKKNENKVNCSPQKYNYLQKNTRKIKLLGIFSTYRYFNSYRKKTSQAILFLVAKDPGTTVTLRNFRQTPGIKVHGERNREINDRNPDR